MPQSSKRKMSSVTVRTTRSHLESPKEYVERSKKVRRQNGRLGGSTSYHVPPTELDCEPMVDDATSEDAPWDSNLFEDFTDGIDLGHPPDLEDLPESDDDGEDEERPIREKVNLCI